MEGGGYFTSRQPVHALRLLGHIEVHPDEDLGTTGARQDKRLYAMDLHIV